MANGNLAAARERMLRPITLEEELRKNPQLKEQDVALLRDWVSMQPHLPLVHDRELVLFLHKCDYSVEASKAMLDHYFTIRTHLPEFFSERDPTLFRNRPTCSEMCFVKLPKTTPEGYSVIMERIVSDDVDKFDVVDVLKCLTMVIDFHLLAEGGLPGVVHIVDMKGVSLGHLARLNLVAVKKFRPVQDSLPYRRKGIHFVNVVPFFDKIMKVLKPFIKNELLEMIHLHTDGLQSLFKFVPQDILPEDYGGSAPSFVKLSEHLQSQFLANREFFVEEEQRRVDEQKRPGRPRSAEDLFGVEGTFKKLDID